MFNFIPSGCNPGVDCVGVRVLVLSFSDLSPIADGAVLYTCRLVIDAGANLGPHPVVCSRPDASSGAGDQIEVECIDGVVDVTTPGGGGSGP